jgi:hypothetical protein
MLATIKIMKIKVAKWGTQKKIIQSKENLNCQFQLSLVSSGSQVLEKTYGDQQVIFGLIRFF